MYSRISNGPILRPISRHSLFNCGHTCPNRILVFNRKDNHIVKMDASFKEFHQPLSFQILYLFDIVSTIYQVDTQFFQIGPSDIFSKIVL